jgi:hypothetical protein
MKDWEFPRMCSDSEMMAQRDCSGLSDKTSSVDREPLDRIPDLLGVDQHWDLQQD